MADVAPILTFTFQPPSARVCLSGDFDLASRDHLEDVLSCLRARECDVIEVDAQDVTFIDASCLSVLYEAARQLTAEGGMLVLGAASPTFTMVVRAAGYHDLPSGSTPMRPLAG